MAKKATRCVHRETRCVVDGVANVPLQNFVHHSAGHTEIVCSVIERAANRAWNQGAIDLAGRPQHRAVKFNIYPMRSPVHRFVWVMHISARFRYGTGGKKRKTKAKGQSALWGNTCEQQNQTKSFVLISTDIKRKYMRFSGKEQVVGVQIHANAR